MYEIISTIIIIITSWITNDRVSDWDFHFNIYILCIQHPLTDAHCGKTGEERKNTQLQIPQLPAAVSAHTKHSEIPEVSILHSLSPSLTPDKGL